MKARRVLCSGRFPRGKTSVACLCILRPGRFPPGKTSGSETLSRASQEKSPWRLGRGKMGLRQYTSGADVRIVTMKHRAVDIAWAAYAGALTSAVTYMVIIPLTHQPPSAVIS